MQSSKVYYFMPAEYWIVPVLGMMAQYQNIPSEGSCLPAALVVCNALLKSSYFLST